MRKALTLVVISLLWACTTGIDFNNDSALLPLSPDVTDGVLPNGMRYVLRKNGSPEDKIALRLVVDAGSILEEEDQLGVAHLVEHMAFNGTEKYNQQEIIAYFESIGMRFGADLNAYTSFDETVYMINFPADDQDILDQTLDVVDQWINHVSFDPEELEKERGVVMEEWRRSQSAEARVREQQRPYLYKDSLYAERVPIGKPELIAGVSRDRVIDFYRKWYHPPTQPWSW
jgi:zinc protease